MSKIHAADDITIRDFRMEDYSAVIGMWERGKLPVKLEGRDSRASIARQISFPNVLFLVAESAGRLVGTVLATHDGRKGWINRLAVREGFRRSGIARRLVDAAESWFKDEGLGISAALIEDGNTDSLSAFEKLGYVKHPEILYFTKRRFPGI